ncbi:DNA ligase D [Microbaculum marinum]|uniref:DNA ligase (ATP) n=1 Tax=Microbaculum marinum TaxID=1764581 RepID=A0AAW9RL82_9HYPH
MSDRAGTLEEYNARRDFGRTREPKGKRARRRKSGLRFLVQRHDARREHYDFRLEWDGVLKSWAVTKGPSLDPADKRLAVRTEDHPMAYGDFEGTIPKGEYGAGTVMLWDTGTWEPIDDPATGLDAGKMHFRLDGERMKGEWILIRMKPRGNEKRENWLLMKADDEDASTGRALIERFTKSVTTGRTLRQIAGSGNEWTGADDGAVKPAGKAAASPRNGKSARSRKPARLPGFEKPQLARLVSDVPAGEDWLHEMKFDGYRCLVAVAGGKARCYTRSGLDWTDRFQPVADACARLDCDAALIDGEVVAADTSGASQFSSLQQALKDGGSLRYYAFDLLSLDGADLRGKPLLDRKEALKTLLESVAADKTVQYSEHVRGNGDKVFQSVCKAGREGIIAKKADAPYAGRRAGTWLKIKCTRRQEFVIGGYSPSDKKGRQFASLLLGTYEGSELRYRGRVGTGFSEATMDDISARLAALERKTSPFAEVPREFARDAVWVTPKLVAEVDFTEFTSDGHVRHGSFLGLRDDKKAKAVTLEKPKSDKSAKSGSAGSEADPDKVLGVHISSADRVVYPQQGVTKIDLARYYEAVSERMLPLVENRLLSLVRCPQGRNRSCFYQKHASEGFPDAIRQMDVRESSGGTDSYMYVTDGAGIVSAVQMGTLEFHIWWSRVDALEKPDRLVFDLDPDEGLSFSDVRTAAFDLRDRLSDLGLKSVPLVTGGKGVHVVVPLTRRASGEEAKGFAEAFARSFAADEPERFTATMSKAKRKGRIFIDWLRNERGSTAIAPYSTRSREGAPVATPIDWDELTSLKAANVFRVADVIERVQGPDPWAEAAGWRQSISKKVLEAVAR